MKSVYFDYPTQTSLSHLPQEKLESMWENQRNQHIVHHEFMFSQLRLHANCKTGFGTVLVFCIFASAKRLKFGKIIIFAEILASEKTHWVSFSLYFIASCGLG